jgi:hypothetical protein
VNLLGNRIGSCVAVLLSLGCAGTGTSSPTASTTTSHPVVSHNQQLDTSQQTMVCLVVTVNKYTSDCDNALPDDFRARAHHWCSTITVVRPTQVAGHELFFVGTGELPNDSPFEQVGVELEARMFQRYVDMRADLGPTAIEFVPCH